MYHETRHNARAYQLPIFPAFPLARPPSCATLASRHHSRCLDASKGCCILNKFKNILTALTVAVTFTGALSFAVPSPAAAHNDAIGDAGISDYPFSNRSYIPWTEYQTKHYQYELLFQANSFDYTYANSTQGAPGSQYRVWLGCASWSEFWNYGGNGIQSGDIQWGYTSYRDQVANGHDPWEAGYGTAVACPPGMGIVRNCGSAFSYTLCPGVSATPGTPDGYIGWAGEPYAWAVLVENSPW